MSVSSSLDGNRARERDCFCVADADEPAPDSEFLCGLLRRTPEANLRTTIGKPNDFHLTPCDAASESSPEAGPTHYSLPNFRLIPRG